MTVMVMVTVMVMPKDEDEDDDAGLIVCQILSRAKKLRNLERGECL